MILHGNSKKSVTLIKPLLKSENIWLSFLSKYGTSLTNMVILSKSGKSKGFLNVNFYFVKTYLRCGGWGGNHKSWMVLPTVDFHHN